MRARTTILASLLLAVLTMSTARSTCAATEVDLKKAVPADVHMAIYGRHNPERDYQSEYAKEAWETMREERIGEKLLKIVTSRVPKDKLATAESKWEELEEALEPIKLEELANAKEGVMAQRMSGPFNQTLFVVRMDEQGAADFQQGVKQAFEVLDEWGGEKVRVETTEVGDAEVIELTLPDESPMQPTFARQDELVFMSTSPELLRDSLELVQSGTGESKFDDPRVAEALEHLPEPEDALYFFDGAQMFKSMGEIGNFIRTKTKEEGKHNEDVDRVAGLMDRIIQEVSILDYEITVEYTEDGQNRTAAIGKLPDDAEDKFLVRALSSGKPFDDWHSWIPAEATSYSLSTGVNLHIIYEGVLNLIREEFPESHEALAKFDKVQEEVGVNIDEDILQSFSGECVSFSLPGDGGSKTPQSVTALRCENPEKIKELIGRAIEGLQNIPAVKSQGLALEDVEGLEGFQEIRAMIFNMVGAKPVFGFHDGWMIIATNRSAAEKLLAVRSGESKSIDRAASFNKFDLKDIEGDTYSVSYSDVGGQIRQIADFLQHAGTMAPMFVAPALAQADPEVGKAVMEGLSLLPSLAKVIRKFDFYDHKLTIVREGPIENTYLKESVTLIKKPSERVAKSDKQ